MWERKQRMCSLLFYKAAERDNFSKNSIYFIIRITISSYVIHVVNIVIINIIQFNSSYVEKIFLR